MQRTASYRADIDGLRALAVAAVVLFHLHARGFSGGYVGVDVFFVISGYLITGLIAADLGRGTFSLRGFYTRRVRRLAPAMIVVTVAAAVAAWILLRPEDMRAFAASLSVQFIFLQNVEFLRQGEYFRGGELKLLLHTWTLAVEEQFYLLWPLFLLLTRRITFARRTALIAAAMFVSFLLNLVLMRLSPKASFYLLPARAWELGLGGLLALAERQGILQRWVAGARREVVGVVGLIAVCVSVVAFDDATPFPGTAALLPVFGTALVIASGVGAAGPNLVGRLLSHRLPVYVGLISYPIYLWHWPLISIARHLHHEPKQLGPALTIIALTVSLAALTYRFVETPIRSRRWLSTGRAVVSAAACAAAALVAFGVHSYVTQGALYRFSPAARPFLTAAFSTSDERCGLVHRILHPSPGSVCALREQPGAKQRVLLWGNSHADMWARALTELSAAHGASLYLNARNCRAMTDFAFCGPQVQEPILRFVEQTRITDIVFVSNWYGALDVPDDALERTTFELFARLDGMKVRRWMVIDTPQGNVFDPLVAFDKDNENPQVGRLPLETYLQEKRREEALFARLDKKHGGIRVIDPSPGLCDETWCWGGRQGQVWYRDKDHITIPATRALIDRFLPVFAAAN